jgi:NADPH:quinone reductase-like Zn-dependent oxidoreductase
MLIIQLRAISLNPVDYKIRQGDIRLITGSKFPKILGIDFTGIVKDTKHTSTPLKIAELVHSNLPFNKGQSDAQVEYPVVQPP